MVERFQEELNRVRVVFEEEDTWRWRVKSTYLALHGRDFANEGHELFKEIWKINTPPKINIFLWRMFKNRLPTGENLRKRNLLTNEIDGKYHFCKGGEETITHVFFRCDMARQV